MAAFAFKQVDVFSGTAFGGNPVAVVLGGDALTAAQMQRVATWTNLSETTFVLRPTAPQADYRLRIFTPAGELPFAGHPTVGSAHAVLEAGFVPAGTSQMKQECGAGLLAISVLGEGIERQIFAEVPPARIVRECADLLEPLDAALGARVCPNPGPLAIDVGPTWIIARLESAQAVAALAPNMQAVSALSRRYGLTGITVFAAEAGGDTSVRVRSFAPNEGVPEDPVCGSGNACVGKFLAQTGLLAEIGPEYVASQGREIGRDGRVSVRVGENGSRIQIGGMAITRIDGSIEIPSSA